MKNDARKMALENQIELAQQNAIDFTHACMTIALHDVFGVGKDRLDKVTQRKDEINGELKQQLAEAQAVVPADLVADKETADSCYLNIDGIWGMALPSFQRLVGTGEDFNHAAGNLLQLCDHIHEELVKMTIANDKETLSD